jgi:predicted transcriptional regulator
MSLVGNLKTVSFSDLLQLISTNKKTGMLSVTHQSQQKSLFFLEGDLISFITTDREDWHLSQLLLHKKKIDKKDWEKALLLSKSSGKRIAEILVELGLISRRDILEALKTRIEEVVFAIFGWEEAEFEFMEGKLPPPTESKLKMNTMGLIMEGAKRVDEWSEIQKNLPPGDFTLELNLKPPAKEGMVNLTLDEYLILLLIDGQKSVSEILMESSLGEFTTSKSLSDLISNGLVLKGEQKSAYENKEDEEKALLDVVFQVYHHCFSMVEEILTQNLGQGKDELLNRLIEQQKKYYPILVRLLKKGFWCKESFLSVAKEVPQEIKLHKLLDSLNSILFEYMKNLYSILGINVKNRLCDQIKREIAPFLEADRLVTDKYQLQQEVFRVLDKV